VANLPFALDDEGLQKLFKDLKVTKAHVVKNRNQRSKGFGFVEFANEADQKSALTASEKMVVEGRELIVKVALTAPEPRDNKDGQASSGDASSSSSSTPAAPTSTSSPAVAAKEAQPAAKADDKSS
jgi:RNA recognition motif-containing protein